MVPDQCKLDNPLAYGDKYYYFRVRIWNSRDEASPWKEGSSFFKTPVHEYPSPNFSWDPTKPRINEDVQFTDLSRAYGDGNAIVSWFWTIPDSDATEEDLITNNPMVKFTNISGTRSVKLRIQDQDGLYCEESKDIQTQGKLPKWREILPW